MRVAIVHDYIKEYGGAERVLEALHDIYPDATVFTSVYLPSYLGPHRERFRGWKIKTSWAQYLPFKAKLISPLRLISPFLFRSFNFSQFDVVIVSATGAYFPNSIKTKSNSHKPFAISHKPIHICYCHTPPRYLYGYATAREWKKNVIFRVLGEAANHFLRQIDYKASQNVDRYIANSEEVAGRIKKFYRRDSTVIYPPVNTSSKYTVSSIKHKKEENIRNTNYILHTTGYYLTGGRLARAKHVDLIVKACSDLGVPLKVFGKGFAGYESELRAKSKEQSVEFVGEVSDQEKLELMSGAKAFLFASEDEDFGITPVEAMGQGTPVIAYRSGGVKETVIDGETGVFFDELNVESLKNAIKRFEKMKLKAEDCKERAEKFSEERFKKEIQRFVEPKSS